MKISVLTIHIGFNFGSSLQTIATECILQSHGCEVEIINYHPERVTYKGFFRRILSSPKKMLISLFSFPNFVINRYVYYSYLRKQVHLTRRIFSINDLKKYISLSDFYITGSDQVWNSLHNQGLDKIYYYDFLPKESMKIAFSSSFGREQLSENEYVEVKKLLKNYDYISVREKSAKSIIESMGYNAVHLLDPTLLLSIDDWKPYIYKKRIKVPYLLVYIPYNTISKKTIYQSARMYAQKYNLKVVTFSWNYLFDKDADKTIFYANPSDFLSLMYYADYIITNSFHGTAFSINLNKQFWVYNPTGFSTRIDSLLESTHLEHRKLTDRITEDKVEEIIDYSSVNEVLKKERTRANQFLKEALTL